MLSWQDCIVAKSFLANVYNVSVQVEYGVTIENSSSSSQIVPAVSKRTVTVKDELIPKTIDLEIVSS